MKRTWIVLAFVLGLLLAVSVAAQQAPTPQAPANQGNQPPKPGPAEKTASEPATPATREPQQVKPWTRIPIPALPPFHAATPKRIQLPNGMTIFLQEDHELPLITAFARVRGGSREEPASKVGLVDIYGDVWRTGGTKTKSGDQMDDMLEMRAAKIETGGSSDSTSISLNCLKGDFDDVFALLLELLHDPAFREDKIALAKDQLNTTISRRNDDVNAIAGREAAFLAYGKDNPYVRVPEYATVAAITRDDLVRWHQQFVQPNNILFGVAGDFDSAQMEAKLRKAFESWPKGPQAAEPQLRFTPAKPGYYYVPKEDVNQSAIRMVTLGIQRNNPDYFAVEVLNEIFGGGFSSRLFKNIRTRLGLAYNVGGGIGAAFDHPGVSRITLATKTATTAEAIKSVDQQIEELLKDPATPAELKLAKDGILNSFIFNVDTPEKVLHERMAYDFYGYPLDFLERYRAGVEKVSLEDVARVAHKYVKPGMFAVLVVGNDDAGKEVAALGPVQKLDISIPTATAGAENASVTPKPTTSNAEGKALIAKVVEGMGGAAKLQSIKAMRTKMSVTQNTPQGPMPLSVEKTQALPDRMAQVVGTPMGEMKTVLTPTAAFMTMAGQVRDLPAQLRESGLEDTKREPVAVAQHADDPKYVFVANGTEKIGGIDAAILDINADGAQTRWYVDPKTGHVLRTAHTALGQRGPVQRVSDNSDWKTVDGLTLPTTGTVTENGKQNATVKIDEIQINPPVDPKLFEKPAATASSGGQ